MMIAKINCQFQQLVRALHLINGEDRANANIDAIEFSKRDRWFDRGGPELFSHVRCFNHRGHREETNQQKIVVCFPLCPLWLILSMDWYPSTSIPFSHPNQTSDSCSALPGPRRLSPDCRLR